MKEIDSAVSSLKRSIDHDFVNLTSLEKSTVCKILGDYYCQILQAEHMAMTYKHLTEKYK